MTDTATPAPAHSPRSPKPSTPGDGAPGAPGGAPLSHHPAYLAVAEKRANNVQLAVADAITKFAGSMMFVYVHILLFVVWMLFIEKNPWPTLTLAVSLEAIFLSTFVMIGQNRQGAFAQAKADHDFNTNEQELRSNTEITKMIHQLTEELHRQICLGQHAAAAQHAPAAQHPPAAAQAPAPLNLTEGTQPTRPKPAD